MSNSPLLLKISSLLVPDILFKPFRLQVWTCIKFESGITSQDKNSIVTTCHDHNSVNYKILLILTGKRAPRRVRGVPRGRSFVFSVVWIAPRNFFRSISCHKGWKKVTPGVSLRYRLMLPSATIPTPSISSPSVRPFSSYSNFNFEKYASPTNKFRSLLTDNTMQLRFVRSKVLTRRVHEGAPKVSWAFENS